MPQVAFASEMYAGACISTPVRCMLDACISTAGCATPGGFLGPGSVAGNHSSPGRLRWASIIRVVEYQMSSGSDGRSPTGATGGRVDRLRLIGGPAAGGDSGDHGGDSGSAGGDAVSIASLDGDDVIGWNMPDRGPGPGSRVLLRTRRAVATGGVGAAASEASAAARPQALVRSVLRVATCGTESSNTLGRHAGCAASRLVSEPGSATCPRLRSRAIS